MSTPVLWLCGPTGVGKSTVGWEIFSQVRREGATAAYLDLAQISFCRPESDPGNHRIKAAAVAALWTRFRAAGARCLILSGDVPDQPTADRYALPGTTLTLCRLHARQPELIDRLLRRGRGEGPPLPGDELRGQHPDALRRLAKPDPHGIGIPIDTDGRTVEEIAHLVRTTTGWP